MGKERVNKVKADLLFREHSTLVWADERTLKLPKKRKTATALKDVQDQMKELSDCGEFKFCRPKSNHLELLLVPLKAIHYRPLCLT